MVIIIEIDNLSKRKKNLVELSLDKNLETVQNCRARERIYIVCKPIKCPGSHREIVAKNSWFIQRQRKGVDEKSYGYSCDCAITVRRNEGYIFRERTETERERQSEGVTEIDRRVER